MTDSAYEGTIIIGAPRSGTTLLRRILNGHPDMACPAETNVFSGCGRMLKSETIAEGLDVGMLSGLAFAGFAESAALESLREFAFEFHRQYARKEGKRRWASKTAFDLFYLEAIEKLCGDHARFICLQRHGLDVACSLKDLCDTNGGYLSELHEYIRRYPSPLEAFCHVWVNLNRSMVDFMKRHPANTMLVKYEDLAVHPESVIARIARFIDVEWSPEWLDASLRASDSVGLGDWKTYSKEKVDTDGVNRWRNLSKHTISMMGRICNPMLEASGYAPVAVRPERSAEEARHRYQLGLRIRGDLAKNERTRR